MRTSEIIFLMATAEIINHILVDKEGRAWIDSTRIKVIEVATNHLAYGWSAEEITSLTPKPLISTNRCIYYTQ